MTPVPSWVQYYENPGYHLASWKAGRGSVSNGVSGVGLQTF